MSPSRQFGRSRRRLRAVAVTEDVAAKDVPGGATSATTEHDLRPKPVTCLCLAGGDGADQCDGDDGEQLLHGVSPFVVVASLLPGHEHAGRRFRFGKKHWRAGAVE